MPAAPGESGLAAARGASLSGAGAGGGEAGGERPAEPLPVPPHLGWWRAAPEEPASASPPPSPAAAAPSPALVRVSPPPPRPRRPFPLRCFWGAGDEAAGAARPPHLVRR